MVNISVVCLHVLLILLGLGGRPVVSVHPDSSLGARQAWSVGWWSSELQQYGCRPIIFIFAKATYEPGNLGGTIGPTLSDALKTAFGVTNVATQGVDYYGLIDGNYYPGGAPPWAIYDMQAIITSAAACPNAKIVVSGYSQGAAVAHRAIEALPATTRSRISGVVTFGDTQALQDGGRIRGFPANKTLIICNAGDIICAGYLVPLYPAHWDYVKWVPTATLFLAQAVLADGDVGVGGLAVDLEGLGELGPGIGRDGPVPNTIVAFPAAAEATSTGV